MRSFRQAPADPRAIRWGVRETFEERSRRSTITGRYRTPPASSSHTGFSSEEGQCAASRLRRLAGPMGKGVRSTISASSMKRRWARCVSSVIAVRQTASLIHIAQALRGHLIAIARVDDARRHPEARPGGSQRRPRQVPAPQITWTSGISSASANCGRAPGPPRRPRRAGLSAGVAAPGRPRHRRVARSA